MWSTLPELAPTRTQLSHIAKSCSTVTTVVKDNQIYIIVNDDLVRFYHSNFEIKLIYIYKLGLAGSMAEEEELVGAEGSHGLGDLQNDKFSQRKDSLTFGICGTP